MSIFSGQGVQNLASQHHNNISFFSFSLNREIRFLAFLTDFSDSFKSNWTTQEVYGKMDPISTFKNTTRKLSFSFDVPSNSLEDAIINYNNLNLLIQGLYPIYNEVAGGASILSSPPLFRVKFANLVYNASKESTKATEGAVKNGLLGYLDGFDFKPQLDSGFFINNLESLKINDVDVDLKPKLGNIYPKLLKASVNFNVIHEHPLGNKVVGDSHVSRIKINDSSYSKAFPHNYSFESTNVGAREIPTEPSTVGAAAAADATRSGR